MPQMAPYSWLILMLLFSMIFLLFNSFLYFIKLSNKINYLKFPISYKFMTKW